jgi:hypothetical protein
MSNALNWNRRTSCQAIFCRRRHQPARHRPPRSGPAALHPRWVREQEADAIVRLAKIVAAVDEIEDALSRRTM